MVTVDLGGKKMKWSQNFLISWVRIFKGKSIDRMKCLEIIVIYQDK